VRDVYKRTLFNEVLRGKEKGWVFNFEFLSKHQKERAGPEDRTLDRTGHLMCCTLYDVNKERNGLQRTGSLVRIVRGK
jgi:hypothetical protein